MPSPKFKSIKLNPKIFDLSASGVTRVRITIWAGQIHWPPKENKVIAKKAWAWLVTIEKENAEIDAITKPGIITFLGPIRSTKAPRGPVPTIPVKAPQAISKPPKVVLNPRISCM